jgi:hypothetical protein
MKKDSRLLALVGMIAVLLTVAALLFPLGAGLVTANGEPLAGYNFILGNDAEGSYTAVGGMIAAFVLAIVGGAFQLFALVFSFGTGAHHFSGFMHVVGGLCLIIAGALFFLAKPIIGNFPTSTSVCSLGWGYLTAAICALVSGGLSAVFGFLAFKAKE